MMTLDMTAADLDYDTIGGALVDEFERTLSGNSPYLGTLPWVVSFEVHEERVDGRYVSTVREEDSTQLVRLESDSRFPTLEAIFTRVEQLLCIEQNQLHSAKEMRERLAELGYRLIAHATGRTLGHVSTHTLVADSISQLDAALQLRVDPDVIYDLLDAGADPLRQHVKFGQPYQQALLLANTRPAYAPVVDYMRALGAH